MSRFHLLVSCLLATAGLLPGGCSTTSEPGKTLTLDQRASFMRGAKPPEAFGLTIYRGDEGPVFAGSHRLHHGQATALDFAGREDHPAPVIELRVAPKIVIHALLDTTSGDSWTTLALVAPLGGRPLGPPGFGRTAEHVLDDIGGLLYIAPTFHVDTVQMENALFYARASTGPLGPAARWVDDPAPTMVLGNSFLRTFPLVQFDLPHDRLLLATSQTYEPDASRLVATLPLLEEQGALACAATLDGHPVKLLLDVAGDFELAMKNPLTPRLNQVTAGDLVFRKVVTQNAFDLGLSLLDFPRLGRRLLQRFVVTIDYRQKLVHFERPPDA